MASARSTTVSLPASNIRAESQSCSIHCRGAPSASSASSRAATASAKGGCPGPYNTSGSCTRPSSKRNFARFAHFAWHPASQTLLSCDNCAVVSDASAMSRSSRSRDVGVHTRKPRRPSMQSSALRTATQGCCAPETSATRRFARSKPFCVPLAFTATNIAARTTAKAPGLADMGDGDAAAKRSRRPNAEKSSVSGRPRASKA
mmetsp:Transcript_51903/g.103156  ORF Transcript_51903/g.103156 Transcript_51903/m.103156 type:complete len:203 (-) Transcript_51903:319-927(-)